MDISILTPLVVSAVAPLLQKGAEKLAEKAAEQGLEQRGKIWNLVKGMFAEDELTLINFFEQNPENVETQAELSVELEHLLKTNSDIAEQIAELIKQIPHSQEKQNTGNQTGNKNNAGQDVSGSTVNRSKMSNDVTQTGLGQIGIQGISGPTINVTQIIGKSYQYNDLLDQLKTQQKLFDRTPEAETQERLKISARINELTDQIEQFRQDVLKLAEAFQNIEINTERLQRAKEHFDRSEIGGARIVLEMELEQMQSEQKHLLREREHLLRVREHYEADILPKLQNNSEEFYLLALSTRSDYRNPNRFEDVRKYFQSSIESYPTKSNVFDYAYFLLEHNQFPEAEYYYNLYLEKFKNEIGKNEFASILNNLAILHRNQNKYDEASKEFEEALRIYRQLAATNSQTYLPDVAMTLNNLATLHQYQNKYDEASKEFEESLQIRRQLAETNPQVYLPYIAITLNNLAVLNQYRNKYDEALNEYMEALRIRRQLAEINPHTYLPDVAMTLINLSIFYQNFLPDREKSIAYAVEAVMILLPIAEKVPYTQKYMETARTVLADWGLNTEEIEKLAEEKRSAEIEN